MIDYFAIAITHGLIALACWRLLARDDLDDSQAQPGESARERPWLKQRSGSNGAGQVQGRIRARIQGKPRDG